MLISLYSTAEFCSFPDPPKHTKTIESFVEPYFLRQTYQEKLSMFTIFGILVYAFVPLKALIRPVTGPFTTGPYSPLKSPATQHYMAH